MKLFKKDQTTQTIVQTVDENGNVINQQTVEVPVTQEAETEEKPKKGLPKWIKIGGAIAAAVAGGAIIEKIGEGRGTSKVFNNVKSIEWKGDSDDSDEDEIVDNSDEDEE